MAAFLQTGLAVSVFLCLGGCVGGKSSPNIIFILTDDQDVVLDGMVPMSKTRHLIGDAGITFSNMFTSSPLCCPSRASILTGRYTHNQQAVNNSLSGNCSSAIWQQESETQAFPTYLKKLNYQTFFAGKYLNQYGKHKAGGPSHVPPGWDHWYGLVGNSKYYNYTLSVNGKAEKHGDKYPDDYFTEIIGSRALEFLDSRYWMSSPFFMMLSTPACHAPFTPAPKFSKAFPNVTAPKNGSFNHYGQDKHWLLRNAKHPLSKDALAYIETTYKNRWRTLLTVDDIVESVVKKLEDKNMLNDTYIFFSSDNGYHLGQFSLPNDKRQMYDFDIRVPLMVRGPGIKPGQKRTELALNIDFAPTFIELAGGTPPPQMDGKSIRQVLTSFTPIGDDWRTDFIVEHQGEYVEHLRGCPQYEHQDMSNCEIDCVCNDSANNTYTCVRTVSSKVNLVYCIFSDDEDFVEVYDLDSDPHQLSNIARTIDPNILVAMNQRLVQLSVCSGKSCQSPPEGWEKGWEKHWKENKNTEENEVNVYM